MDGMSFQVGRSHRNEARRGYHVLATAILVVLSVPAACSGGGGGGTSAGSGADGAGAGVVGSLCARLDECNYLVGMSVSECRGSFETCLGSYRPSQLDDWEQDINACLAESSCRDFWSCHSSFPGCHVTTSPSPVGDAGSYTGRDARGDTGPAPPPDPCPFCPRATEAPYALTEDGYCDRSLFYDFDCRSEPDSYFTISCGKSRCSFEEWVCEAMHPCGLLWVYGSDFVAQPCPNDFDCAPHLGEPPLPCQHDGHCDTWCPLDRDGIPLDIDCDLYDTDTARYCPGREGAGACY